MKNLSDSELKQIYNTNLDNWQKQKKMIYIKKATDAYNELIHRAEKINKKYPLISNL